jgi:AraC family transcriptional regulator
VTLVEGARNDAGTSRATPSSERRSWEDDTLVQAVPARPKQRKCADLADLLSPSFIAAGGAIGNSGMTTRLKGPARGPVQLSSYQAAEFKSGSGLQVGSAYTLNGIGAALVEETPNEIVAPAVTETVLIISLSGRPEQRADLLGKKILRPFPRNSVIVIPAGLPTWWSAPRVSMRQIHIHIQPSFLERIEESRPNDLDRPKFGLEDPQLAQIGRAIETALTHYEGTGTELYLEHLLLAYIMQTFRSAPSKDYPRGGGLALWAERQCIAYMHENLSTPLLLGDLAEIAGLSPHHFAKMFRQNTGAPPHAYLMMLRMNKAQELLSLTSLPVSEVAAIVGYSAPSTFARLFKAHVGISPLQFRQLHRPRMTGDDKGDLK